ncbi:MAG TPA: SDR family NAD(P)-dependent oxidoreductase, partial [Bryobacteraceae bacterium]|nr:SDR family NAD(P)-dependent oxidoreductase [Bryobacteraceae bacterium]
MSVLSLFDLSGKTALVTGCRRGIGRAMAVGLAEAGADIVGVSASLEPDSEVEREVRAVGRPFDGRRCDFAVRSDLYRFIAEVRRDHPVIDILVNNAGTILRRNAADHPDEFWDTVLETNATAGFILAREFGRDMLTRRS